jgi:hypothetical protein
MDPEFTAVSAVVEVGSVPGVFAAADPTGRFVAVDSGGVLTVYDLHAGLAAVASYRMDRPHLLAVHPGGQALAVLNRDWSLQLWRSGEPAHTMPTGLGDTPAVSGSLGGPDRAAWLAFTADGSHLLFGAAVTDGPARLHLLDAATLATLDTADTMRGYPHHGAAPLTDWGEGVETVCAPLPATAVGFATNSGDDPHVVAVAEVRDGRLRVHGAAGIPYASQIPGERVNGIAMTADGELLALDSDGFVTAFSWRKPDAGPRRVANGYELLRARYGDDDQYQLGGALFAGHGWVAVDVIKEDWIRDGRFTLKPAAIAFLGAGPGRYLEVLELLELPPGWQAGRIIIENGFLRHTAHGQTRIARWGPPRADAGTSRSGTEGR